jgi:hypothetical protein
MFYVCVYAYVYMYAHLSRQLVFVCKYLYKGVSEREREGKIWGASEGRFSPHHTHVSELWDEKVPPAHA